MAEKKPVHKNQKPTHADSREALLLAARRVFSNKGYEGATVKNLAEEAGVNISLVSYHFGGKEGLYRTCLESFGSERVESTERILRPAQSREDFRVRLQLFAEDFIEINLRNAETCKIIHRAIDSLDPIAADIFKSFFLRMFTALQSFVTSAKDSGIVRANMDVEIASLLMFGSLVNMLRSQDLARLLGKRTLDEPTYRAQVVSHWVENTTTGLFASSSGADRRAST